MLGCNNVNDVILQPSTTRPDIKRIAAGVRPLDLCTDETWWWIEEEEADDKVAIPGKPGFPSKFASHHPQTQTSMKRFQTSLSLHHLHYR